jgi:hypothetical protein
MGLKKDEGLRNDEGGFTGTIYLQQVSDVGSIVSLFWGLGPRFSSM